MSAANRPRGATFTRLDDTQAPQLRVPRKHLLAAAAVTIVVTIALSVNFSNKNPSETGVELATGTPATGNPPTSAAIAEDSAQRLNPKDTLALVPEQPWVNTVVKKITYEDFNHNTLL